MECKYEIEYNIIYIYIYINCKIYLKERLY